MELSTGSLKEDAMLGAQALEVMVYCDDVEACRICWTEKLGFQEETVRPGPEGSVAPVLSFGPADAHIVLMDRSLVEKYSPEVNTLMPSLLFRVADIEAVHEEMERRDATVSDVVDMGGMRSFSFSDDEGHWMAAAEA
ncbi:MAG: VOC family protein [Atopobiaceae bacterium]